MCGWGYSFSMLQMFVLLQRWHFAFRRMPTMLIYAKIARHRECTSFGIPCHTSTSHPRSRELRGWLFYWMDTCIGFNYSVCPIMS